MLDVVAFLATLAGLAGSGRRAQPDDPPYALWEWCTSCTGFCCFLHRFGCDAVHLMHRLFFHRSYDPVHFVHRLFFVRLFGNRWQTGFWPLVDRVHARLAPAMR